MKKTNAMRILDSNKVKYDIVEYSIDGGISGVEVASSLGEPVECVYKTLVTVSKNEHYVFVIPVARELDLKKAACISGEKKIEMLHSRDLLKTTGYIHGGCSPIGMKKQFKTYIDKTAEDREYIYVSGGKIGVQVKLKPADLMKLIDAKFEDLTKEDENV
ncbi:Cys-tRNA(Pro) deacylase [Peptoniphilus sp. oral taxon 386]|uniref:Cys-tRNA(Pro) deacylase n=1 Tax=Peptoniphilus sp. oral taxon 386 TaxID=652713 RepID=UPI0001DA9CCC|nr:Cys-tRNA(Pro) deacylase [Peptoniphilus sp. oral taxon 386]EFI42671.1 YbaK/EbsC protein [Peptoniphilus sp. oral taxon 386 str. F0131]